jgi:nucleoside-triphosphatase
MNILITAPPKMGKSTLLKKIIQMIPTHRVSGILTEEILENNNRVGFKAHIIGTESEFIIAHTLFTHLPSKVGKYFVDSDAIYRALEEASKNKKEIFFLDEIGRMQACSKRFLDLSYELLTNRNIIVIGTIVFDDEEFARKFKKLKNVTLKNLTPQNRDQLLLLDILDMINL